MLLQGHASLVKTKDSIVHILGKAGCNTVPLSVVVCPEKGSRTNGPWTNGPRTNGPQGLMGPGD